jgi:sulfur-carrier protein adenylyltransferase/sulfurtransferase
VAVDLTPDEVLARLAAAEPPRIVDVRTPMEYAGRHIPGAVLIPIDELAARVQELDPEEELVVVCEHGIRSAAAVEYLTRLGYEQCANMRQGMCAWRGPVRAGMEP